MFIFPGWLYVFPSRWKRADSKPWHPVSCALRYYGLHPLLPWVSLTVLPYEEFCSPAGCQTVQRFRNSRPRALWLLLTECHDPELSAFALTGGCEIPGLKVLWDYISEGICDDGSWQVLLSSEWMNSPGCHSCRELISIKDAERQCSFISRFFLFWSL